MCCIFVDYDGVDTCIWRRVFRGSIGMGDMEFRKGNMKRVLEWIGMILLMERSV